MIGFLKGVVHSMWERGVMVEVQGIGYEVQVPSSTLSSLPPVGQEVTLYTHLSWREEGVNLFGFETPEDREMFRLLIEVSGVGPRLAMTILSSLSSSQLLEVLASGDVNRLKSIHGIGKKTAARLCVDLKERAEKVFSGKGGLAQAPDVLSASEGGVAKEAVSGLVNLGYSEREAWAAVKAVLDGAGEREPALEELITASLRRLVSEPR